MLNASRNAIRTTERHLPSGATGRSDGRHPERTVCYMVYSTLGSGGKAFIVNILRH